MTSDAKIEAYIKNNAPDVDFTDEQLKDSIDKLKMMTPEQLAYITRNIAEPT